MFHRSCLFLVRSVFAASVVVSLIACGVDSTGSEPLGDATSNVDKAASKKKNGGADASIQPASDGGAFGADASCCDSDASAGDFDGGSYGDDAGSYGEDGGINDGADAGAYGDDDSSDAGYYGEDAGPRR
jgi:hypothetical protein